jgi:hypothetical protein
MSQSIEKDFVKICAEETSLRAVLMDVETEQAELVVQRRAARQEKMRYERALWLGPIVTQVDIWPLYILYTLGVVGLSSLLMFGVLRSIWFPVWLAGVGATLTAMVLGFFGWKLRSEETDIRERFKEQPAAHLQELRTAIRSIDERLKPIRAQREQLLIRLNDLMVRKRALENDAVIAGEQQRQPETQEREKEEFDKKQVKLHLLNSRWETLRGIPFEEFLAQVLRLHGYQVELTQASNDQGVDLVAVIYGQRVAIQAKGYANTVGNDSVQQVVAGKRFYGCTHTAVITNSSFTNSALTLAESNECLMIDYTVLPTLILHGWPERGVRR